MDSKPIKMHAMSALDYKMVGSSLGAVTDITLYDQSINAQVDWESLSTADEHSTAVAHVRRTFNLCVPVFNYVLSRQSAKLLQKMLGIDTNTWMSIVNFELIYNKAANALVDAANAEIGVDYLYGAEIAKKYIDELDIQQAIVDELYKGLSVIISERYDVYDIFNVNTSGDGVKLVDKYYVSYDNYEAFLNRSYKGFQIEDLVGEIIFEGFDSRLSYLLNLKDKAPLYGMLNTAIVIIPPEMRPGMDNRIHKLTKSYNAVLKANSDLSVVKNSFASPKDIIIKYKILDRAVSMLQYKKVGLSKSTKKDDKAILERVKTKQGQIRLRNLGKRQDYSGRAVVCINPYLPLDHIRVPESMLPKLMEYHLLPYLVEGISKNKKDRAENEKHIRTDFEVMSINHLTDPKTSRFLMDLLKDKVVGGVKTSGLLSKVPFVMGRQPTLHKQSLLGFHVEPTKLNAIEVSPLVCPGYNMDFDGDQAHLQVPLSPAAIKEVRENMMVSQNIYYAKTGECHTAPRMDMIYGLYICTRDTYEKGKVVKSYSNFEAVRQDVMYHRVKVYDTVTVAGETCLAGVAAVRACFPDGDTLDKDNAPRKEDGSIDKEAMSIMSKIPIIQITDKTISLYINFALRTVNGKPAYTLGTGYAPNNTFIGILNRLVELGFRVAKIYSPNMSVISETQAIPEYDNAVDTVYSDLDKVNYLYGIGLETSTSYRTAFNAAMEKMDKSVTNNIKKKLGADNGYVILADSGARGNTSNLAQIFAHKGRVKKNETEAFDALLVNSYVSQLTPLEHFVDAYGGRQGLIDKSLKTGDTGYAMRKMWHAMQEMHITCKDCGTHDGITISKDYIASISDVDSTEIAAYTQDTFAHAIMWRYDASDGTLITDIKAKSMAKNPKVTSIKIRSPLTCSNPCCSKCYGFDMSKHRAAIVGTEVGLIAAQSMGEPATQLAMKQFQKGGVVGQAAMTSAFDKFNAYLSLMDIAKKSQLGTYIGYDPLAWETGEVFETPANDITKKIITIGQHKKRMTVPRSLVVKRFAKKGEGLSYRHGDYDMHEMIKISGVDTAQLYLMFKLYNIYRSSVNIAMNHFEVLVASMTRYMICDTDREDIRIGQYCTKTELLRGSTANTKYIKRMLSIDSLINASNDALDAIIMENQAFGLSRVCLLQLGDSFTKPLNRMVLGKTILSGSNIPTFINDNKEMT